MSCYSKTKQRPNLQNSFFLDFNTENRNAPNEGLSDREENGLVVGQFMADHEPSQAEGQAEISEEVFAEVKKIIELKYRLYHPDWKIFRSIVAPPPAELFCKHLVVGLNEKKALKLSLKRRKLCSAPNSLLKNTVYDAPEFLIKFLGVGEHGILISPRKMDTYEVNFGTKKITTEYLGRNWAIFDGKEPAYHFDPLVLQMDNVPPQLTFADFITLDGPQKETKKQKNET